jgi:hypothetical protein
MVISEFVTAYKERSEATEDEAEKMACGNIAHVFEDKSLDFAAQVLHSIHADIVMRMQGLTRDSKYGYYCDLKTCREIYKQAIEELNGAF